MVNILIAPLIPKIKQNFVKKNHEKLLYSAAYMYINTYVFKQTYLYINMFVFKQTLFIYRSWKGSIGHI